MITLLTIEDLEQYKKLVSDVSNVLYRTRVIQSQVEEILNEIKAERISKKRK